MVNHPNRSRHSRPFKITISGAMTQNLERILTPLSSEKVAVIVNSKNGWQAYLVGDPRLESHTYELPNGGLNVSRLINQPDGAERIAELLGISK